MRGKEQEPAAEGEEDDRRDWDGRSQGFLSD